MWEDIRWEADNVAEDLHCIICLVREDIDIIVTIAEKEIVLQCAIYDSDLWRLVSISLSGRNRVPGLGNMQTLIT